MRRTAGILLLTCLYAVGTVLVAPAASACSCVGGTTQGFFADADAVFIGSLVSREGPATITSSADPVLHVFAVDTVYKGTVHESQGVLSPVSGATCGLELSGDGPFVVFATRSADLGAGDFTTLAEDQYAAFLCGGTGPVTAEVAAELTALAGSAERGLPTPPLPGDGGTEPAGSSRLPIVLAAVGGGVVLAGGALLLRRRLRARG